jgi:peptide/nickel transport system ATP-binding protein/oligopeptide transport system ATP-binding protein
MQIIFQDPYSSLDPRIPVGESIAEGLRAYGMRDAAQAQSRDGFVKARGPGALSCAALPARILRRSTAAHRYCARVALRPETIVCDEPVSALDVSIQAQVLNLLMDLQRDFQLTYLFIAHNMQASSSTSAREWR